MAYRKYSRKTYRKKGAYKRKSYAKKTRKISPMKRMVRMEIARAAETKSVQSPLVDKILYPSNAVNFPDNVIPLGPNNVTLSLQQGAGQGQRIGNVVHTKRLTWKGFLNPLPYNVTTNQVPRPLMVEFIFCYDREDPNDAFVPGSTFFQNGSSTVGFANNLTDLVKPINEDRYRVFARKTYKLGNSSYPGSSGAAPYQADNQFGNNNDFKLNHKFSFDLTKWYPKVVKFNDNLANPMTRNIFVLVQYVDAYGSSLGSAYQACEMSYCLEYKYEDA